MNLPYVNKLLDKVAIELLYRDSQDLFDQKITSFLLVQVLNIYHKHNYKRSELWTKLTLMLASLYS